MKHLPLFSLVALFAAATLGGCGHDSHDDEIEAGRISAGSSERVDVHADAASVFRLEECDTARIIDTVIGPSGDEDLGDNVDAEVVDVIRKNEHGDCETEIRVDVDPDAPLGDYTLEVEFEYFVIGDPDERHSSGFVHFTVVAADSES